MDASARAENILRTTRALVDTGLRVSYLVSVLRDVEFSELARALDLLSSRAEQAEEPAREVLMSLATALNAPESAKIVQRLRAEAANEALLSLERLVRSPHTASRPPPPDLDDARVPDYGRGRPLTLGERKSLARRPDRETMARLLDDPHPDVIRGVLRNPRLTEDDVIRLATKRPCRPDALLEIARSPKWIQRSRVRMAIVLNPDTPADVAAPIAGLLLRQELRFVVEMTHVSPAIRALCLEHLERRPPGDFEAHGDDEPKLQ